MVKYSGMKKFEVLPHAAGSAVRVVASTRAGLITAALQGVFAAAEARVDEMNDEKRERPFSIVAEDFPALLKTLLDKAIIEGLANTEAYDEVRFTLITDKAAEGAFVGKGSMGFGNSAKSVRGGMIVAKNEADEWETTVVVEK